MTLGLEQGETDSMVNRQTYAIYLTARRTCMASPWRSRAMRASLARRPGSRPLSGEGSPLFEPRKSETRRER